MGFFWVWMCTIFGIVVGRAIADNKDDGTWTIQEWLSVRTVHKTCAKCGETTALDVCTGESEHIVFEQNGWQHGMCARCNGNLKKKGTRNRKSFDWILFFRIVTVIGAIITLVSLTLLYASLPF